MPSATSYGPLLDALRGVAWPARRPLRGAQLGTHRSRLRGTSPEFAEYRPYRQGDDPRQLDWKLLARTDRAYLRITSDRSTLASVIVVDASASMAYPTATHAKWEHACRIAVGLVAVAHASGDPVGVIVPGERETRALAPRTRRGVVAEAARLLESVRPMRSAPLAPAVARLRPALRVAILSDLLGDATELLRVCRSRLIAGAEVHLVHIVAREELQPPGAAVTAVDPEDPQVRRALVESTRDGYQQAFADWRAGIARAWRDAGAGYHEVVTDEPAERAVRRVARALAP